MRTLLFATAAAAAMTIGFFSSPASAQAPLPHGANASKFGIAVVDISYIFKKHERFIAQMESMKTEMQTIENELKGDRDRIQQSEERRNSYNVGSPEYKQLDEDIARMMADFNVKMTRLRKDFLEREAKVYYQTYLEVTNVVDQYAKRHNIGLVLRFNGEQPDPNRREEVLHTINRPVVFQNQIDITGDVLQLLNRDTRIGQPPTGSQLPPR